MKKDIKRRVALRPTRSRRRIAVDMASVDRMIHFGIVHSLNGEACNWWEYCPLGLAGVDASAGRNDGRESG